MGLTWHILTSKHESYLPASLIPSINFITSKQWLWYYNIISILDWFGIEPNSMPRHPISTSKQSLRIIQSGVRLRSYEFRSFCKKKTSAFSEITPLTTVIKINSQSNLHGLWKFAKVFMKLTRRPNSLSAIF